LGDLGHCSLLCPMRIALSLSWSEARSDGTDHQYHYKSVDSCRVASVFSGLQKIASALVGTTNLRVGFRSNALFVQRQGDSVIGGDRTECGVVVVFDVSCKEGNPTEHIESHRILCGGIFRWITARPICSCLREECRRID